MKKLILTSFAFTGLTLIAWMLSATSCARNTYNVLIKNIDVYPVRYYGDSASGFINQEILGQNDTIRHDHLGIITQVETHKFLTGIGQFHLGDEAMAFKPGMPRYNSLDRIRSIQIYTQQDYNADYQAGDEITAICSFLARDNRSWLNAAAFDTELQSMSIVDEYFTPAVISRLEQAPATAGSPQQFITQLTTTDGVVFRDTTYSIRVY